MICFKFDFPTKFDTTKLDKLRRARKHFGAITPDFRDAEPTSLA